MLAVRNVLLILHFVGLASLLGGFLVQLTRREGVDRIVNTAMLHGALTQLVTGLLLVGVRYPLNDDDPSYALPDNGKIAVKLVVELVVLAVVLVGRRKEPRAQQPYWLAAGLLTLLNVVVAVVW